MTAKSPSKTTLAFLVAAALMLAGCVGGDDGDEPGTAGGPAEADVTLDVPEMVFQNETFSANWTFTMGGDSGAGGTGGGAGGNASGNASGNTTGGNASAGGSVSTGGNDTGPEETGIAYGPESVSDPNSTESYGNTTGQTTSPSPGEEYTAEIEATEIGTIYVRAYVKIGEEYFWSQEKEVRVEAIEPVVVEIGGLAGPGASYTPATITIAVGEYVVWTNNDQFGHTASQRTGPAEFDTGNIAPGESSDAIKFEAAGDYTYACDNHATMQPATITVTEA